jgi:hypothetical protein
LRSSKFNSNQDHAPNHTYIDGVGTLACLGDFVRLAKKLNGVASRCHLRCISFLWLHFRDIGVRCAITPTGLTCTSYFSKTVSIFLVLVRILMYKSVNMMPIKLTMLPLTMSAIAPDEVFGNLLPGEQLGENMVLSWEIIPDASVV